MARRKSILVTGANGMLAQDLIPQLHKYQVFSYGKTKLNIADRKIVEQAVFELRPDVVINCAGYTDVDGSEINPAAYDVNALGVYHLAHACQKVKARLVHFSTDYVFDGVTDKFYKEDDGRNPLNHYGKSKMMGEVALQSMPDLKWTIFRVQWLFGLQGKNFVRTMLRMAEEGKPHVNVVNDQFGRPTNTWLLCQSIIYLIDNGATGIWHLGANDYCSWYDFACEILRKTNTKVLPCSSDCSSVRQSARSTRFSTLKRLSTRESRCVRGWTISLVT
jgi:dTDP-4-dehydrorhamnose reductase